MSKTNWEKWQTPPQEMLRKITGGKLKGFTDIKPIWRFQVLTEVFGECGVGWWYDIKDIQVIDTANGEKMIHVCIELYTKTGDVVSNPIVGVGGDMLVKTEKGNLVSNDEGFKMALTDAISVACRSLGIAADVYAGIDRTKYSTEEATTLATVQDFMELDSVGALPQQVAVYYKTTVEELTSQQVQEAIQMQRKANAKKGN